MKPPRSLRSLPPEGALSGFGGHADWNSMTVNPQTIARQIEGGIVYGPTGKRLRGLPFDTAQLKKA